jgi:hypothetical protein
LKLMPLAFCFALAGCGGAVTVRAPICEPPPIPVRLMEPCEEPAPLKLGTLDEMYRQALEDTGPWGRCVRNHDKLVEVIKYRDSICEKFKADNVTKSTTGWRWPWQ